MKPKRISPRKPPGVNHYSPSSKIMSIYASKALYERIKDRATSLGMNVSQYVLHIAREDVKRGGPLPITPD